MPTFNELINTTKGTLLGYTQDQEQYATLSGSLTDSATSFTVSSATVSEISRGLIEIDDELIQVLSVDQANNTVTVLPGGRGWMSTTAAAHSNNAVITDNPKFPRIALKRAINDAIKSVFPDLFGVATTEITKSAGVYGYELPAATAEILAVRYSNIGPTKVWSPLRRYQLNGNANATDFTSGKSLDVYDDIVPGRAVRVTYSKAPTELANTSDDYATVTGLPASSADVIIWGACYRLVIAYEAGRLQQDAIESTERAQNVPAGSASQTSRYFYTLYA